MWFKLLTLVHLCAAFPLKCPEPAQWALRSNGHCTDPSKYFCLQNDLINGYSENCTRSDFQQPGRKAVLRGGIDAEICSVERYQPFPIKFFTNASTHCIFLKSFCNAEGQVVYDHGNRNTDRTCICDYRRGYTFLVKPENPCFCKPSQEDCSCYLKTCSNGSHILSSDYQCINNTDLSPVTQCRTITDTNDNSGRTTELKGNILKETNNPFLVSWNKRPAKLVVSGCTIVVILVLSIRILWGCRFRALPNQLDEEDRMQYTQLINDSTMEKRYFVKIMIVGKEGVGKTCLLRRLLNERIDDVTSTDGVDIVVRRCKINVHDGEWIIEKDISDNPVHRIQNALNQNQNMEKKTTIQTESMENEIFQIDDIKNDTSTVLSTLKPSTPMVARSNEYTTDEGHISSLHEESTDTNDIKHTSETLENPNRKDIEMEGNVKDNKHRTITDTETTVKENEDDSKLSSLEMPTDLMSEIFSSPSASDGHRDPSALCGLWDFAGQKEFYATHQVFLTSSAIYLVVADMKTDILKKEKEDTKGPTDTTKDDMKTDILKKEKEDTKGPTDTTKDVMFTLTNLQTDGEYVDFWFDSIHCYQRADVNEPPNASFDPPVIVVFTGADMYEKEDLDKRKHELQQQLITLTANQTKYKHFRKCFYLSNKNDPKKVFQKLREAISETARKMQNWGESVPLKWILLEHLIEINKKKGTKFITFEDMVNLAKHKQIDISENEVISFLRVQSKIGNIIYFEEIKNLIILEPQWLVNAFRCLVSDKLDFDALNDKRNKICSHWEELKLTGKISDLLITTLFEQKDENQFLKKKEDLLEVMKMFDILVDIHDKDTYMIPSMMPSSNFETVCQKIGISEETCERTSWFCLKFEFLPPVFFNHLSAWFITNYKPSKLTDNSNVIALYREICVFDFDNSACDKLLMTMSTDTIAVQVVSFDTKKKDLSVLCISVRKILERKIKDMTKRYSLNLCYEKRFKCSAGKYNMNTMPMKDLISAESFYCLHHKKAHESKLIYSPWTKDDSLPNEIPDAIKQMSEHDRSIYLEAAKNDTIARYNIRIILVGKRGVGKTSLLRRLMNEGIEGVESTDGINIEVKKCKINLHTKEWIFPKGNESPLSEYPNDQYADCRFLDFAGQKEFYATHQTFLSRNAIYLLVVDASEDFEMHTFDKMIENQFDKTGDYIDFWLDNIHCYTVNDTDESMILTNDLLNPPVIIIGTGMDKVQDEGKTKDRFKIFINNLLREHPKRKHFRKLCFLSNTKPSKDKKEFQTLRNDIFDRANETPKWGDNLPTRWIFLEKEIERLIDNKEFVISYDIAKDLASKCSFSLEEVTLELDSFLKYEHEIGNLIFFEDIKSYIILEPKWLVDVFKCFVAPFQFQSQYINMSQWSYLQSTGHLSNKLIEKLFTKVPVLNSTEHKAVALQVMEKFDIIVKPITTDNSEDYYMPCMIEASEFNDILETFNVRNIKCSRTSWFGLQFKFLPPAFFNHILVTFLKKYSLCIVGDRRLAIYRGIGVFDLEASKCLKLVVCLSENSVAMQVWQFKKGICYHENRKYLTQIVGMLQQKYRINIPYRCFLKCPDGTHHETAERIYLKDASKTAQHYCPEHASHTLVELRRFWFEEGEDIIDDQKDNTAVKCHYCEKMPVYRCYECSNVLCDDCYLKHDKLTNTKHHTFQSTNDKLLLNNTFEVSGVIVDMKSLPGGLLVFVVFRSNKLLTYSVSDKQRNEISVGKLPHRIAIVDRNTVAVLLSPNYVKIDSIGIVDIRQRQVIQHVDCTLDLPSYLYSTMFYTDDQLYISNHSGITVTDMSGTIDREIDLGFEPRDMCYDTKAARIYCIDHSEKKLICIDRDGNTIFTFTDTSLTSSERLAIDNEGYVLILCEKDYNLRNFKVHRISPDGKSGEVIITGKQNNIYGENISNICFQEESDKLVIGMDKTVYTYKKN